MNDIAKATSDKYERNVYLKLKSDALKREHVLENRKLLSILRDNFKQLVKDGEGGSQTAERLVRVMRHLEESIETSEKDIPSLEEQHRELIKDLGEKYPEELERRRLELENQLHKEGLVD